MWGMEWSLDDFEGSSHPEDHMSSREVENCQGIALCFKGFHDPQYCRVFESVGVGFTKTQA